MTSNNIRRGYANGGSKTEKDTRPFVALEYEVSGANVCMYITSAGERSVHVRVVLYGGLLGFTGEVIDSDSVSVPTLGEN